MNIRQRFHRLTLWNKINVFGAVASVIGIVLSVLFWKFPGSGTVPLAYSIAFDATLVELLDPYTWLLRYVSSARIHAAFRMGLHEIYSFSMSYQRPLLS